jgi:hypothetical protein
MAASTPQRLRRVLISIAEDKLASRTERLEASKQLLEMLKAKIGDRSRETARRRLNRVPESSILG